ncbi:hypothetical protein BJ165DRAFT_1510364 [Panaeolus papilionaceus]|nr:hypothetical protein BJ165DRAFT_1510364 [Panaeolus papilionaceus]
MLQIDANPPAYNSPSASDDITNMLERALAVQNAFATARINAQKIDKAFSTTFEQDLTVVDDMYNKVFDDSRTAATKLHSVLDHFQKNVVPLSQNNDHPVDRRAKSVKSSADKIAAAAKESAKPLESGVAGVIQGLTELYEQVDAAKDAIKQDNKEVLDKLSEDISELAQKISEDGNLIERLTLKGKNILASFKKSNKTLPTPANKDDKKEDEPMEVEPTESEAQEHVKKASVKKALVQKGPARTAAGLADGSKAEERKNAGHITDRFNFIVEGIQEIAKFFESEARHKADKALLEASVEKLAKLNADVDAQLALLDRSGDEILALTENCNGLVLKLGDFSAIWKKLETDAALLSEFITENGLDETTIVTRVAAESQVYDHIKYALDEYALRVQ